MLEDIRGHSPHPDAQEIRWMAARPFRQVARVAILAIVAVVVGNLLPSVGTSTGVVTLAAARP